MNAQSITEIRDSVEAVAAAFPKDDSALYLACNHVNQLHDQLQRLIVHRQYRGDYRCRIEAGYIQEDLAKLTELLSGWIERNPEVRNDL